MRSILRVWRHQSHQQRAGCRWSSQHDPVGLCVHNSQSNCSRARRSLIASCAASPPEDRQLCAGIPVSSANTTVGHSLWQTLQNNPLDFVPAVQSCLRDVALEAANTAAQNAESQGVLASIRRKALLEDVLYLWAVAEACLADAALQASFRQGLTQLATRATCLRVDKPDCSSASTDQICKLGFCLYVYRYVCRLGMRAELKA